MREYVFFLQKHVSIFFYFLCFSVNFYFKKWRSGFPLFRVCSEFSGVFCLFCSLCIHIPLYSCLRTGSVAWCWWVQPVVLRASYLPFKFSVSSEFKLHGIVWIKRGNIHTPLTKWRLVNDCYCYRQVCCFKGEPLSGLGSLLSLFASSLSPCPSLRGSPGDGCHAPESLAPGELWFPQVSLGEIWFEGNGGWERWFWQKS